MPQSGKRWAQAVKALAQHKDSVTQVTKCQHASCQMTHDQERTEGGGGTEHRSNWTGQWGPEGTVRGKAQAAAVLGTSKNRDPWYPVFTDLLV